MNPFGSVPCRLLIYARYVVPIIKREGRRSMTKQFALIATTLCFAISPDFADDLPSRHGS